jgi:hypothetical protein
VLLGAAEREKIGWHGEPNPVATVARVDSFHAERLILPVRFLRKKACRTLFR